MNKIIGLIFENPQAILIITSLIILTGYALFIYKNSKMVWLSVFLFFTLGYFGAIMNTIRHQIAIVILLFSYNYIRENKFIKFIGIVLIAPLFHNTAIIFLVAYPISKCKFSYKLIAQLEEVTLIGYFIFPYIFNYILSYMPKYQYYMNETYLNGEIRLATIIQKLISSSILAVGV